MVTKCLAAIAHTDSLLDCFTHIAFQGQYLRPTDHHLAVVEYVRPEQFQFLKEKGDAMGFKYIAAGPLVRSSYKAGEFFLEHMIKSQKKAQE